MIRPLRDLPSESTPSMAAAVPDESLVARARGGDRWAIEAIFRRYVSDVLGMATRLLGSTADADDVVQDTFFDAFRALERLEDPTRLRSWLMGIAIHRAKRKLRARKVLGVLGLAVDPGVVALIASDASPEDRAELTLVNALLVRLPADERIAWMLRHIEGERLEDIAEMLDCSLSTAKRRIGAAEERLRVATRGDES